MALTGRRVSWRHAVRGFTCMQRSAVAYMALTSRRVSWRDVVRRFTCMQWSAVACMALTGRRVSWRHAVIGSVLLFCCSLSGGSGMSPSCVASHIFFLRIDLILPVLKPFLFLYTHYSQQFRFGESWYFFSMALFFSISLRIHCNVSAKYLHWFSVLLSAPLSSNWLLP